MITVWRISSAILLTALIGAVATSCAETATADNSVNIFDTKTTEQHERHPHIGQDRGLTPMTANHEVLVLTRGAGYVDFAAHTISRITSMQWVVPTKTARPPGLPETPLRAVAPTA